MVHKQEGYGYATITLRKYPYRTRSNVIRVFVAYILKSDWNYLLNNVKFFQDTSAKLTIAPGHNNVTLDWVEWRPDRISSDCDIAGSSDFLAYTLLSSMFSRDHLKPRR